MSPTLISHRPQTLKQAKKAYRKSGATVRLSASEIAVIERRAVLQERADRIKEREARRKANIKKKDERNQRERDARHRMGIASPVKEGIHIGPSQLSLGAFMGVGAKRKREDDVEDVKAFDIGIRACGTPTFSRTPWRNPLRVIPTNEVTRSDEFKTENPHGLVKAPVSTTHAQETSALKDGKVSESPKAQALSMGPPPPPKPLRSQSTPQAPQQLVPVKPPPCKSLHITDENWDDFIVSSTQIARELSPPATKSIPTPRPSTPLPPSHTIPTIPNVPTTSEQDATDLLDLISTQDLDFSGILTQIPPLAIKEETDTLLADLSTQDLDFSQDLTQLPPPVPDDSSDFDEDLTEEDLEETVLVFEPESTTRSSTVPPDYHKDSKKSLSDSEDPLSPSDYDFEDPDFPDDYSIDQCFNGNYPVDDPVDNDEDLKFKEFQEHKQYQDTQLTAKGEDFELSTQDLGDLDLEYQCFECDCIS